MTPEVLKKITEFTAVQSAIVFWPQDLQDRPILFEDRSITSPSIVPTIFEA
ncbi:MAG: hypothetical protein ACFLMY_07580 [Candidatus Brachytrichaceae bacterium NZ_4S206]|jgi:hypothetical protein